MQIKQLSLNHCFSHLRGLKGLCFKGFDGFQLAVDIIRCRLEVLNVSLNLVDHGLVLENLPVVREVYCLRLLG